MLQALPPGPGTDRVLLELFHLRLKVIQGLARRSGHGKNGKTEENGKGKSNTIKFLKVLSRAI